jgi:heme/copper-type cytochrome/quinol oxidase subunit 2
MSKPKKTKWQLEMLIRKEVAKAASLPNNLVVSCLPQNTAKRNAGSEAIGLPWLLCFVAKADRQYVSMSRIKNGFVFLTIALVVCGIAVVFGVVAAQDWVQRAVSNSISNAVLGRPVDRELNFQYAGTAFEQDLLRLHNLLFGVDLAICSLVAVLLLYSVWRFRKSRNAVASQRTHNTPLEILWTVVPVAILAYIAVPSFALVYRYNVIPSSGMTLKVTGHQWYWEYQYQTNGNLDINSTILPEAKLKPQQGQHGSRLLAVDNYAVLPVGTVIRIQVTGADVIHSWSPRSDCRNTRCPAASTRYGRRSTVREITTDSVRSCADRTTLSCRLAFERFQKRTLLPGSKVRSSRRSLC